MIETKIATLKGQVSNGVSPAMATPLLADGYTVNTAVIPQLVDFLIAAGVKAVFAGGTTGEGILLTVAERMRLHETAVSAVANRVPVLLHVGDNRNDSTVALAQHAQSLGVAGIAAITPFFYGISDDGLADYYGAITTAVPDLPLLLYDMPHLAINGISPALLKRLTPQMPSLAGLKSSRPDVQMVRSLVDATADHQMLLAGNESAALGLLGLGVHGLISGLSTAVPEPFVALTTAVTAADLPTARHWQRCINDILGLLPAGARIGGIKQILRERGIPVGPPVPPRPDSHKAIWPHIAVLLDNYGAKTP